jgi:hypothetical protein
MKTLLVIMSWLSSLSASAQRDYRPFVEEGKRWNYITDYGYGDYSWYGYLSGDTIMNGHNCKKYYDVRDDGEPFFYAALYEENKKSYYYKRDGVGPIPLFDFSLEKGQTIDNNKQTYIVADIDTVFNSGQQFKRFYLQDINSDNSFIWIEGVGINEDLFNPFRNLFGGITRVISCEVNGGTLFTEEGFYSPRIPSSIHANEATAAPPKKSVFDLQGRRIDATPAKGVYIRNGRKQVVR